MLGRRVRRALTLTTLFVAMVCVPAAPAFADLGDPDPDDSAPAPTTTTAPAFPPAGAAVTNDAADPAIGGDAGGASAGTSPSGGSARNTRPSPAGTALPLPLRRCSWA